MTSAKVQIPRRDRFSAMICVLVRTAGTGFRTPTNAEGCPRKNISALSLAFDGKMCCSAPHHFCSGSWHGVAVKIGCSPLLKRKDLCLCSPSLQTCLAGGGGTETARGAGDASALGSVRWVPRSMPRPWRGQLRSFCPFLCNLSRKNDISKLNSFCSVSLYKYCVYTHTDTHTYTNTNPQTKLHVWSAD